MKMLKNLSKLQAALIVAGVFVFGIVGLAYAFGEPVTDNSPERKQSMVQKKEERKEDISDLDLTVKPYTLTLEITNNESKDLKNCEVQVNPSVLNSGYTKRVDLPSKQPVDISYDDLTKGSERFDSDKYVVDKVVVTRCDSQTSRMGIYGN